MREATPRDLDAVLALATGPAPGATRSIPLYGRLQEGREHCGRGTCSPPSSARATEMIFLAGVWVTSSVSCAASSRLARHCSTRRATPTFSCMCGRGATAGVLREMLERGGTMGTGTRARRRCGCTTWPAATRRRGHGKRWDSRSSSRCDSGTSARRVLMPIVTISQQYGSEAPRSPSLAQRARVAPVRQRDRGPWPRAGWAMTPAEVSAREERVPVAPRTDRVGDGPRRARGDAGGGRNGERSERGAHGDGDEARDRGCRAGRPGGARRTWRAVHARPPK